MQYIIRYRVHRPRTQESANESKEETVIHADGAILRRWFRNQEPGGHFHLAGKAVGSVSPAAAEKLHAALLSIVRHHEPSVLRTDSDGEVIIEETGLRISADAGLVGSQVTIAELMEEFLQAVAFAGKTVSHL